MNLVEQLRTWEEMPRRDDDLAFLRLNQLTENAADLIERQAAQIEMLREALGHAFNGILYYHHAKLVKIGIYAANEALSISPDQALEQFAAKVRSQCESVARSGEWGLTKTGKAIAAAIGRIKDLP